jgi:lipoprotein-releasing system permease protein
VAKKRYPINSEVAYTYLISNKRLTLVAAMGVTIGIAVFIFMNSLMAGFDKQSSESFFKSIAHIRIYKNEEISKPFFFKDTNTSVIVNPKIVPTLNTITNPKAVIDLLRNLPEVTLVTPQISTGIFYNNAKSQISGKVIGIVPDEANMMYNMNSFIVDGSIQQLKNNLNGILVGSGIAEKMNISVGGNISVTSSVGITKVCKVVGIFKTNNSVVDKSTSYVNLSFAQQILKKSTTYITDINVNIRDYSMAKSYAKKLEQLIPYTAEDWETANETYMAASRMRAIIIRFVSISILLVAGFGIYNILNMTIMQKINDIAILKAIGFNGRDVIRIFVTQAIITGCIGIVIGCIMAALMVFRMQKVYVGGDIGYFPIFFAASKFLLGICFGFLITFLAGYIPARKAANIDPVSIFRK